MKKTKVFSTTINLLFTIEEGQRHEDAISSLLHEAVEDGALIDWSYAGATVERPEINLETYSEGDFVY